MIEGILTPCRAAKIRDVETRVTLLTEIAKGLRGGLEIVGPFSDFIENSKAIVDNLKQAKAMGVQIIIIHSPVIRDNYASTLTNISRPESQEILGAVLEIAHEVGAVAINVHGEIFFTTEEVKNLTNRERDVLKKNISKNLKQLHLKESVVKLAIENMPWPLMGDIFFGEKDMVWDPLFADPLELYQFCEENDLWMTFDTCHWSTLGLPLLLTDAFKMVEGRVTHLHLSDAYGHWLPGTATFKEGLIPGDGNLGKGKFHQLLQYLRDCTQQFTLTLEVNDKNFLNPRESRESLKRVIEWIASN